MSDVGIVGSKDIVRIFTVLGVSAYPAENISEAKTALKKIIQEQEHKVVFVLESLAAEMREEMRAAAAINTMTVVPIPDRMSQMSYLDDELKRLSKEAIGMEV